VELVGGTEGPAIFGVTYAALYARFAAQWTYIANLYNQIKQAQVSEAANLSPQASTQQKPSALAQWQAGFIEDALDLHMASKPGIAGVIRAWVGDDQVRAAFKTHTPNAARQWEKLQKFSNFSRAL